MVLGVEAQIAMHIAGRDTFSSCDYLWETIVKMYYYNIPKKRKKRTGMKYYNYPEHQKGHNGKLLLHFLPLGCE